MAETETETLEQELFHALATLEFACTDYSQTLAEVLSELDEFLHAEVKAADADYTKAIAAASKNEHHRLAAEGKTARVEAAQQRVASLRTNIGALCALCATVPSLVREFMLFPECLAGAVRNPLRTVIDAAREEATPLFETGNVLQGGEEIVAPLMRLERLLLATIIETRIAALGELAAAPGAHSFGLKVPIESILKEVRSPGETVVKLLRNGSRVEKRQHAPFKTLAKRRPGTFAARSRTVNPGEEERMRLVVRTQVTQLREASSYVLKTYIEDPSYGVEGQAGRTGTVTVGKGISSE